jgi:hypothetical protein
MAASLCMERDEPRGEARVRQLKLQDMVENILQHVDDVAQGLAAGTAEAVVARRWNKAMEEGRLAGFLAEPPHVQQGIAAGTFLEHAILATAAATRQRVDVDHERVEMVMAGLALYLATWSSHVAAARGACEERALLVADYDESTAFGYADVAFGSWSSLVVGHGRPTSTAQGIGAATAAVKTCRLAKERDCAAVASLERPSAEKPWSRTWAKPANGAATAPGAA